MTRYTPTGRIARSVPRLQQLPPNTPEVRAIREAFIMHDVTKHLLVFLNSVAKFMPKNFRINNVLSITIKYKVEGDVHSVTFPL